MNNDPNVTNNTNTLNSTNHISNMQNNNYVNNINQNPQISEKVTNSYMSFTQPIVTNPNINNSNENQITLGTTSNVNYADTIGNININNSQNANSNNTYIMPNQMAKPTNIQIENDNQQTYLNELNVNGTYNKLESPQYENNQEKIDNQNNSKKNTITITKELKTIIIIALILLVFIFVMPNIFDLLNNFRFH